MYVHDGSRCISCSYGASVHVDLYIFHIVVARGGAAEASYTMRLYFWVLDGAARTSYYQYFQHQFCEPYVAARDIITFRFLNPFGSLSKNTFLKCASSYACNKFMIFPPSCGQQ